MAIGVAYAVLRRRREDADFRSFLELTPQNGWSLLDLALENRHESEVWVERAAFVLTDLDAEMQSGPAAAQGVVDIRQCIPSHESLHASLIEAVYNASGRPQGAYAFRFLGAVRYRLGETWTESEIPVYYVEMVRLSVSRIRGVRVSDEATQPVAGAASPRALLGVSAAPAAPGPAE